MSWNPHNYIHNTAAQNKSLRIRRQRINRSPDREILTSLPALHSDMWPDNPREVIKYEKLDLNPHMRQWAFNVHRGHSPLRRRYNLLHWDEVAVTGQGPMLKWGSREYNVENRLITRCDYTDIAQEHGAYISNSGSTRVEQSTFLRCGSQGLQFSHRPNPYQQYSADTMPYERPPRHSIVACDFIDCGTGGTRPSYTLTYFDPGSTEWPGVVRVENCTFVADWAEPDDSFYQNTSTGAFVLTRGQGGPAVNAEQGDMLSYAEFRKCLFDYTRGDRPLGKINGSTNVAFIDSAFITRDHPQPWIDIDSDTHRLEGMKTKRILIRNCRARNCRLRVHGSNGQVLVEVNMDTPDQEVWINGITGAVVRFSI